VACIHESVVRGALPAQLAGRLLANDVRAEFALVIAEYPGDGVVVPSLEAFRKVRRSRVAKLKEIRRALES
jgi:hypothetical protein